MRISLGLFPRFILALLFVPLGSPAVEIPLDTLTPIRIGYIDLQRVFDTYPEKSFAEGDLLREIEKRRRELNRRQTEIGQLRQQIGADEKAIRAAKAGQAVVVPANTVPEPPAAQPPAKPEAPPPPPVASTATLPGSTTAAVEPYPTDDPLSGRGGLPAAGGAASAALPGMQPDGQRTDPLASLAARGVPVTLNAEQSAALEKRVDDHQRRLDQAIAQFRTYRTHALGDMKALQTQKTYGVMSNIYAILQQLARDENITVVLDKSYILYGEQTIDLTDRLVNRLQQEEPL